MLWPRIQRESRGCVCLFSLSRRERWARRYRINTYWENAAHGTQGRGRDSSCLPKWSQALWAASAASQGPRTETFWWGPALLSFWWNLETNRNARSEAMRTQIAVIIKLTIRSLKSADVSGTVQSQVSRVLNLYSSEPGIRSLESSDFSVIPGRVLEWLISQMLYAFLKRSHFHQDSAGSLNLLLAAVLEYLDTMERVLAHHWDLNPGVSALQLHDLSQVASFLWQHSPLSKG